MPSKRTLGIGPGLSATLNVGLAPELEAVFDTVSPFKLEVL